MIKYRYRKCAACYQEIGHIKGYVILRYRGAVPFLVSEQQLRDEYFDTMPNEPPIILERRKTGRPKRAVQHRKGKTACSHATENPLQDGRIKITRIPKPDK